MTADDRCAGLACVTVSLRPVRSGAGKAIHTGVTAVLPRGADTAATPVFGAWFAQNGNGEMTGTAWIEESGQVEGPILIGHR